jgi:hypothetical protein
MKIEILRSVMISGERAEAGSFAEVSLADAQLLIGLGKARFAPEGEPAPQPEPEPEAPKRSRKPAQPTPAEEA